MEEQMCFSINTTRDLEKNALEYSRNVYLFSQDFASLKISLGVPILIFSFDDKEFVIAYPYSSNNIILKGQALLMGPWLRRFGNFSLKSCVRLTRSNFLIEMASNIAIHCSLDELTDDAITIYLRQIKYIQKGKILNFNGSELSILYVTTDLNNAMNKLDLNEQKMIFYEIRPETDIIIKKLKASKTRANENHSYKFQNIGGLSKEIEEIREFVDLPLNKSDLFPLFGISPCIGLLLYGPSGTGKTMITKSLANEIDVHHIEAKISDMIGKYQGETERHLKKLFEEAKLKRPSIIYFDELDTIAPKRCEDTSDADSRALGTLLTEIDNLDRFPGVIIIGTSNRPNMIDSALRRPGRFEKEIEIGIPDSRARLDIFKILISHMPHILTDSEVEILASKTHGYVGADIASLCRIAGMSAMKKFVQEKEMSPCVRYTDFLRGFRTIKQSAMREIFLEIPDVKWDDIGGQIDVKEKLRQTVEWPLKNFDSFQRLGIDRPRGVLLYGPPGCSKTMIAKAVAAESGLNFIAIKGPELYNKYVGESERSLRDIFLKARQASPSVIFIDEIDIMSSSRGGDNSINDRLVATLLNEMDGIENLRDVVLLAATNRPDVIDAALMRPRRFDRILYVSPPDFLARTEILEIQKRNMKFCDDVSIEDMSAKTEGFSGAQLYSLCQHAGIIALKRDLSACCICCSDFEEALKDIKPAITDEVNDFYMNYTNNITSCLI